MITWLERSFGFLDHILIEIYFSALDELALVLPTQGPSCCRSYMMNKEINDWPAHGTVTTQR